MPYAKADHAEIYYEVSGDGPPVILAHGAGGNTLVWFHQVVRFAPEYTIINFDHRGWGRSKCDAGFRKARYFADDMRAVLDAVGIDRTAVVCQSMGGWTGMQFALAHPERVSCLVLSGTPAGISTPKIEEIRSARAQERAREQSAMQNAAWNHAHWALAADAFDHYPERAFLYGQLSALNAPVGDTGTAELRVTPDRMRSFTIPTLLLGGENDRICPPSVLDELEQIIPGAERHTIPVSGHSPYFETPDAFNDLVAPFLAKHAR
jgi:pimeloyl-ACP methyl ester carboxylesterase